MDPDSIEFVDRDLYGEQEAKMTHNEKRVKKFNFLKCMFSLGAGGFSSNLKAIHGGKRIK
jgi:hypothetical protein